jgi:pilus assembly protein CpaF
MSRGFGRRSSEGASADRPAGALDGDSGAEPKPKPTKSSSGESGGSASSADAVATAKKLIEFLVDERIGAAKAAKMPRDELLAQVGALTQEALSSQRIELPAAAQKQLAAAIAADLAGGGAPAMSEPNVGKGREAAACGPAKPAKVAPGSSNRASVENAKTKVQPVLMERIDAAAAAVLPREELSRQITEILTEILAEQKVRLNMAEQRELVDTLLDDMLGLGPLEPLLADDSLTDILVNGAHQIYVERAGKLELTDVVFRDNAHVMNIATRIVTRIGRRVDESSPLVDARLEDGSRVNIIIPPLAIDGPTISIRKFAKKKITIEVMVRQNNLSPEMATVLKIAGRARLNILISGGTGSGKTTLLNALSQQIEKSERIVTIEDAAELQLQQPHVVRLETRPANLEGQGEITMRGLLKNSLRMRPDRIILGEVRGEEAVDMLQAMNTGHEGSMGTIHANRPREALTRLENMIGMAGINLPAKAVRTQIASALDLIVQVSRMRDGVRRVTHLVEVVGTEGDVITTQDLFWFKYEGEDPQGMLLGEYVSAGIRPHFTEKASYFGLERALMEVI